MVRTVVQSVRRRFLAVNNLDQSHWVHEGLGKKNCISTGFFSLSTSIFPCQHSSTNALFITDAVLLNNWRRRQLRHVKIRSHKKFPLLLSRIVLITKSITVCLKRITLEIKFFVENTSKPFQASVKIHSLLIGIYFNVLTL